MLASVSTKRAATERAALSDLGLRRSLSEVWLAEHSVEKLDLGDVIEERGLMEPSQFYVLGRAWPRRLLLSMSRYGPRSGMLKRHQSKR